MNVKSFIIDYFAKKIVGGVEFESAKRIVAEADQTDLSGKRKFQYALARLQDFGYSLLPHLLNLAIELAVAYIRASAGKQK